MNETGPLERGVGRTDEESQQLATEDSYWAKKVEKIYEGFDRRIGAIFGLKSIIDQVTIEQSGEEVAALLRESFQGIQEAFGKEAVSGFNEYKELISRAVSINKKINKLHKKYGDEAAYRKDYLKLDEESDHLSDKTSELEEDPEVYFLYVMDVTVNGLIKKNEYIKRGNVKKFKRDFLKTAAAQEEKITSADIGEITIEPFTVCFDIKKIHKRFSGMYHRGTPFISIWAPPKESVFLRIFSNRYGKIVKHERMHNFLSSAEGSFAFDRNQGYWERLVKRLEKTESDPSSCVFVEYLRQGLLKLPRDTINSQHGEIVAALEEDVLDYFEKFERRNNGDHKPEEKEEDKFKSATLVFSTAGRRIFEAYQLLDEKLESCSKKTEPFMSKARDGIKDEFFRMVRAIRQVAEITKVLGEEARTKAQILFMMLVPSQYQHIARYLERVYGKELIQQKTVEWQKKEELIHQVNLPNIGQLEGLIKVLEGGELSLSDGDIRAIKKIFAGFDLTRYYQASGIDSIEEARDYLLKVKRILDRLGYGELYKDFGAIRSLFFSSFIDEEVKKQSGGTSSGRTSELLQKLTLEERKEFEEVLEDTWQDERGASLTIEETKKLPLWNIIREAGMEEKISSRLELERNFKGF